MRGEELPVLPAHPPGDRFGRDRAALRLPDFLKRPIGKGERVRSVQRLMRTSGLHTVCEEARCPNLAECFARRTATFMIMGDICTRACGFCAVDTGVPRALDADEPRRVAEAAVELGLQHVVVTSVDRDDLPDGGAAHFRATVDALRQRLPEGVIEVLTPDFRGDLAALDHLASGPLNVFNHNVETVPRLYRRVRPRARYAWSLGALRHVAATHPDVVVKSGLMVGLGEKRDEVFALMDDLRAAGVRIVTIGQYLRPSIRHVPVVEYLQEEAYAVYRAHGQALGFDHVFAGPFVRSSYNAAEALRHARAGAAR
ncbi:MAG: lipoyl synthase [Myxococcales bacterium]|nr:lipoyl synthase [Myxococcales bacterium]